MKKVSLTQFTETSLKEIWKQGFSSDHPEWTKFNAPYFNDKYYDSMKYGILRDEWKNVGKN